MAIELGADSLIVDDRAAVKIALLISKQFKFRLIGTGDVVDMALKKRIITKEEHEKFMVNKAVFRMS